MLASDQLNPISIYKWRNADQLQPQGRTDPRVQLWGVHGRPKRRPDSVTQLPLATGNDKEPASHSSKWESIGFILLGGSAVDYP